MRGMGEVLVHFDGVLLVHPSGVPASMWSTHGLFAGLSLLLKLFFLQVVPCTCQHTAQQCKEQLQRASGHVTQLHHLCSRK